MPDCDLNAIEDEHGVCTCEIGHAQLGGKKGDSHCLEDSDIDGVPDEEDNCKEAANSGQEDQDKDGKGDRCSKSVFFLHCTVLC